MLHECFGGPLDGRVIAEGGPRFTLDADGQLNYRARPKAGQGYYELGPAGDGYYWHPPGEPRRPPKPTRDS